MSGSSDNDTAKAVVVYVGYVNLQKLAVGRRS